MTAYDGAREMEYCSIDDGEGGEHNVIYHVEIPKENVCHAAGCIFLQNRIIWTVSLASIKSKMARSFSIPVLNICHQCIADVELCVIICQMLVKTM